MGILEWARPHAERLHAALTTQTYVFPLCVLLLLFDAVLSSVIIQRVPYTEIDWRAYMQQIALYRKGERTYTKIHGDTGPLVYGAGHVYIYNLLYKVTDGGRELVKAQWIFEGVYILALGVALACYTRTKVPPYILPLLVLSKRLHSIFLLRLFNDCFAILALFIATYAYQRRLYTLGSLVFSFGLAIKLPLLLAFPAIGIILSQSLEPGRLFNNLNLIVQTQIVLGYPFWTVDGKAYFGRAFELSRQFLFKWTVNWRFLGEETFLSQYLSIGLLGANALLVALFVWTRWLRPSGLSPFGLAKSLLSPYPQHIQMRIARNIAPDFVLTSVLTSTMIGLLCARSLHYQFYAYIAWSTPFLLWKSNLPWYAIYPIWALQEWAWNVYPSTNVSSVVVVASLAIQVLGVWIGTKDKLSNVRPLGKSNKMVHEHGD